MQKSSLQSRARILAHAGYCTQAYPGQACGFTSMAAQPCWAQGLVLAVSGFDKPERRHVEEIVTNAGGEYSTGLSRRCTVLLVPKRSMNLHTGQSSRKLELYVKNRHKHKAKLLAKEWLLDCLQRGVLLDAAAYEVQLQVPRGLLPSFEASQDNRSAMVTAPACGFDVLLPTARVPHTLQSPQREKLHLFFVIRPLMPASKGGENLALQACWNLELQELCHLAL